MDILLGFAPFMLFVMAARLADAAAGLAAGETVAAVSVLWNWLAHRRAPRVFELGNAVLFGSLSIYLMTTGAYWSVRRVSVPVDFGLLLLILVSIAARLPFTLDYTRARTPRYFWESPQFKRANYFIAAAWATVFATILGVDVLMLHLPDLPLKVGAGVISLLMLSAARFTSSYIDRALPIEDRSVE